MAEVIRIHDLQRSYAEICQHVVRRGRRVAPRGQLTRELDTVVLEIADPSHSLPFGVGRALHPAIGVVEALQLISGLSVPELLVRIAPNMRQFMEGRSNDLYQHGAYGRRLLGQMPKIINKLHEDWTSRQALANIWQANLDLGVDSVDIPCTCVLRFAIRDGDLHMTTIMRSNDVWWGLPYDVFQFTQLMYTAQLALGQGIGTGTYTHVALSLHAYERDLPQIEQLHEPVDAPTRQAIGVGYEIGGPWWHYAARATTLLYGSLPDRATLTERWMHEVLTPYVKEED